MYEALKSLKGQWFVYWIGGLTINPSSANNPEFSVCMAEMPDNKNSAPFKQQDYNIHRVYVAAAHIRAFQIGSIWENGQCVGEIPLKDYSVTLSCDGSDVGLIHALKRLPEDGDRYLVRKSVFKFPSGTWGSRLAAFKRGANRYSVLIPCNALFSYFYSPSSFVVKRLLSGPFREAVDKLIQVDATSHIGRESFKLVLRKNLSLTQAKFIAPMVATSTGFERTSQIYESLVRNRINTDDGRVSADLECLPPMTGKVAFNLKGKWFKRMATGDFVFLAFRIVASELKIPYEHLDRRLESDSRVEGVVPDERTPGWKGRAQGVANPGSSIIENASPGDDVGLARQQVDVDVLSSTVERRLPKEETLYENAGGVSKFDCLDHLSSSDVVGSQNGIQQVDVSVSDPRLLSKAAPFHFDHFMDVVDYLGAFEDIAVSYIAGTETTQKNSHGVFNTLFPKEINGSYCRWAHSNTSPNRRRQVAIAEINFSGLFYYLFEIQRLKDSEAFSLLLTWRNDYGIFSPYEVSEIVQHCAASRGVWFSGKSQHDYRFFRLKHSNARRSNPKRFANAIYRRITEAQSIY